LWVHDLERGTSVKLTDNGRATHPTWTSDGERIVFDLSHGGMANLYWVPLQGNEPVERLSETEFLQQPGSWSPDGRYLAYVQWQPSEGTAIWLLDSRNGTIRPFLDDEHQYAFPEFSLDGRWLAYTSDELGEWLVWLTLFPDQRERALVSNVKGRAPVWSPDGRQIYYLSEGNMMAVAVDADSDLTLGVPRLLIEGPLDSGGPVRTYDLTPDGTRFIFARGVESPKRAEPIRKLHIVFNWLEELERLAPTE
jgi:Tol biopolymer transport system component